MGRWRFGPCRGVLAIEAATCANSAQAYEVREVRSLRRRTPFTAASKSPIRAAGVSPAGRAGRTQEHRPDDGAGS